MGTEWYLAALRTKECFELSKGGWSDLAHPERGILDGQPRTHDELTAALFAWWDHQGVDLERALEMKEQGWDVAWHPVLRTYYLSEPEEEQTLEEALLYAARIAILVRPMMVRGEWDVRLYNDAGDLPWDEEDGWTQVGARFDAACHLPALLSARTRLKPDGL